MKNTVLILALLLVAGAAVAAEPSSPSAWSAADQVFGQTGKDLPGEVHRFGWPRTDLHVRLGGVAVEPALALGSWAAFKKPLNSEEAVAMGDLVLLGPEVNPVALALQAEGFQITAIHNHLIGESPRVVYLHFDAMGDPQKLAKALRAALEKTATPLTRPAGKSATGPTAAQEKILAKFQETLGRKGTMAGAVLQIGIPRAAAIRDGDMEIPSSMGMANAINVEVAGNRVATTGDFVLIADEVNPVLHELQAHGIEVTALHSHMLRETPRLFFMHFWGIGSPEKVGEGLKAALARVATK
jgi:hypothetical protein